MFLLTIHFQVFVIVLGSWLLTQALHVKENSCMKRKEKRDSPTIFVAFPRLIDCNCTFFIHLIALGNLRANPKHFDVNYWVKKRYVWSQEIIKNWHHIFLWSTPVTLWSWNCHESNTIATSVCGHFCQTAIIKKIGLLPYCGDCQH